MCSDHIKEKQRGRAESNLVDWRTNRLGRRERRVEGRVPGGSITDFSPPSTSTDMGNLGWVDNDQGLGLIPLLVR